MKTTKKIVSVFSAFILLFTFCYIPINAASSPIINNDVYFIKNKRTGKYLTAEGTSSGMNVYLDDFTGNQLQKFKLKLKESSSSYNYYNIISYANPNLMLDVHNAYDTNGTNIKLYTETSYNQAQRFRFIPTNTSTIYSYQIMPKLSSTKVLSVENDTSNSYGFLESDVNVELYSNSPSKPYQDWVLENVSQVNIINTTPITIYQQETSSTCGSACVRMILKKHNIIKSESAIKNTAHSYNPNVTDGYTYVFALVKTLNYYLESAGVSTRYTYDTFVNIGVDYYTLIFAFAIESNQVIQILFKHPSSTCSNTGLPYYSINNAHYVLLTGIKSAADGSNPYACVSDPYYTSSSSHSGIWEIPMPEIYEFSQTKGAYLIFENN